MRRITLFIGSLSGGGAERVTCNLANYLNENGYNIDVVTMSNKRDTYKLDDRIKRVNLLDEKERKGKISDTLIRMRRLKKYVKDNQDVMCYIAMLPVTIFLLIRLRRLTNSKIIISERNNPRSYKLYEKLMMRYASKRCDGLVVQTKEIGNWYNKIKNKVVIPNAINKDVIFPRRGEIEKKIVSVSRLEKQKNIPMLISAFEKFQVNHPDYILEVYGKGSLEKDLKELIKKRKLNDKIILMGYVDNISDRITNAACFVLTSNYEGMPNALIEAMCIGIPCVATDSDGGGVRELIRNNENGFIVEKDNKDELALRMAEIVENPVLARRVAKNARALKADLGSNAIYKRWLWFIRQTTKTKVDS